MASRVIALANQKGGVGKTTTAISLSACLTIQSKRVLLIDLDPQANATSGLGFEKEPGRSLYHALLGDRRAEDFIQPTEYKRLDLIPSELDLAGAEVDIARTDNYLHRLRDTLADLVAQDRYDYIIVDCPPSLGILTMNALTAVDSILIPIQCEYYALEGLSVMTQLVQKLRDSGANPNLEIEGIVMTMYDARTNLSQQVVQDVAIHFGDLVYETLIPRTVRLSEAPSFGKPIIAYDRRSIGSVAYLQLAKEFVKKRRALDRERASEHAPVEPAPSQPDVEPEPGTADASGIPFAGSSSESPAQPDQAPRM